MTPPKPKPAEAAIRLDGQDNLVLVLPGRDGAIHELVLQQGNVEAILRHLLAEQRKPGREAIGRAAGPSWKFLLESGLLAGKEVRRIAAGASGLGKPLKSAKRAEDLGL